MTTDTLTLTAFLTARLDEDYEIAYGAEPSPWREGNWDGTLGGAREVLGRHGDKTADVYYGGTYGHIMRFDPTRALAEIRAKRAVAGLHTIREVSPSCSECGGYTATTDDVRGIVHHGYAVPWPCPTLRIMATVYAEHPDFRDEWRA